MHHNRKNRRLSVAAVWTVLATSMGVGWVSGTAVAGGVVEFESDVDGWLAIARQPKGFAFDQFYPGFPGTGDLTGPVAEFDFPDGQHLKVTRMDRTTSGAIRDSSSTAGACSDAALIDINIVGSRWEFETPIYCFSTYYGSLAGSANMTMRLYHHDNPVGEITRNGGGANIYALGHGFVSDSPVDRIDFVQGGLAADAVLIGAFIGLDAGEASLGEIFIPGYAGPGGPSVQYDFAYSTEAAVDFKLQVSTLAAGQVGSCTVFGGQPNTMTYLAYSLDGLGQTNVPLLNVTLSLRNPIQAGQAKRTNGTGEATFSLPIPGNARGVDVWFQAAQVGQTSNVVATWVN